MSVFELAAWFHGRRNPQYCKLYIILQSSLSCSYFHNHSVDDLTAGLRPRRLNALEFINCKQIDLVGNFFFFILFKYILTLRQQFIIYKIKGISDYVPYGHDNPQFFTPNCTHTFFGLSNG